MSGLVYLPDRVVLEVQAHLVTAYPDEGCGFLLGDTENDGTVRVRAATSIPNQRAGEAEARRRYLIAPDQYLKAERAAGAVGLDIVGTFHSHPDAPPEPSAFDRDHAWPSWVYLIVSIQGGRVADSRAWELDLDRQRFVERATAATEEKP